MKNECSHDPEDLAVQCAKCGACTSVCPVYQVTGRESLTARGRLHLLKRLTRPSSQNYGTIFSACLLCGACKDVCPRKIDTLDLIISARSNIPRQMQHHFWGKLLARKTLSSPKLLSSLCGLRKNLLDHLPKGSGLWQKLALLPEDYVPQALQLPSIEDTPGEQVGISYFSGCMARYLSPDISTATRILARKATGRGVEEADRQTCCGLASFASGNREEAKNIARENIAAFSGHRLPILTSCGSCYHHLRSYPELLQDDPHWGKKAVDFAGRLLEFSEFFLQELEPPPSLENSKSERKESRTFYHDPCHLLFGGKKITRAPRQLIKKITGTPPFELAGGPRCCGQGGLFHLAHANLSSQILNHAMEDFRELSAHIVVTTCSGCLLQWQQGLRTAAPECRASHLALLLLEQMSVHKK